MSQGPDCGLLVESIGSIFFLYRGIGPNALLSVHCMAGEKHELLHKLVLTPPHNVISNKKNATLNWIHCI